MRGRIQKLVSLLCQCYAAWGSLKHLETQISFQRLDLVADRALCHMQYASRIGKAVALRDLNEQPKCIVMFEQNTHTSPYR